MQLCTDGGKSHYKKCVVLIVPLSRLKSGLCTSLGY